MGTSFAATALEARQSPRCGLAPLRIVSAFQACAEGVSEPGPDGPGKHSISPLGLRVLEGRDVARSLTDAMSLLELAATPFGVVVRNGGVVRRWRCADLRLLAVILWDKNIALAWRIGEMLIGRRKWRSGAGEPFCSIPLGLATTWFPDLGVRSRDPKL